MAAFNDSIFYAIRKYGPYLHRQSVDERGVKSIDVSHFNYIAPLLIIIFDFLVQFYNVFFIISGKYLKKGPFFAMLLIMSISILIRSSIVIFSYFSLAFRMNLSFNYALYIDYFSSFFSLPIIFLMSLNRYLCFVSNYYNSMIFERNNYLIFVIFSIFCISCAATFGTIKTSGIERDFYSGVGFVDYYLEPGYKTSIARSFYIFPLGSTICYILLFLHLKQQSKLVMMSTRNVEQKVFAQLLITALFYGLMSIFFEAVEFLYDVIDNYQIIYLISMLNIINYLPEISLPLMLMMSTFKFSLRKVVQDVPKSTTASILNR
ncbi:unnamed protein product [Caenorhabditis angaria]|uniref:Serpentine receptor class gamma n=1 Tax=Caenorhabditis angaria TaxID=860376 RepID=A0A9P1MY54_9PELO|nr:unnamed protein product [Caenorhabditis angaria]